MIVEYPRYRQWVSRLKIVEYHRDRQLASEKSSVQ